MEIISRLEKEYPDSRCSLDHSSPFQLLVATILSAQCTDQRVNIVTPALFAAYPDAESMSVARTSDIERLVRSTGFFRAKTRNIRAAAKRLVGVHGGRVPDELSALVELPGVGRKTAAVLLWNAFGKTEAIAVDTHAGRLSRRLGLTRKSTPEKIERDLLKTVPRAYWGKITHLLIDHGRSTCRARDPRCGRCTLRDLCPSAASFLAKAGR
ncbi:MAG: endonuclease III [Euryarchaeota archaeon]|nr:endonuclease III [Euryarchaeota archaeon]